MLSDLLDAITPEPHPDLVANTTPTNRDMLLAISLMGLFREDRWEPIVRA